MSLNASPDPPSQELLSDIEKGHDQEEQAEPIPRPSITDDVSSASTLTSSKLQLLARRVEHLTGIEARGIHRVQPTEQSAKTTLSSLQIGLLWLSINTAAQNITLGMIGQSVFELGFLDAALCSVFGGIVGCLPVAYMATWGPVSGNRTLVVARYTMGWWPVKLCVLLNLVVLLGYCMIDAVIAGQVLSAVSPHASLSVVVGIIVVAVITWLVTTFGIRVFHYYERYAVVPQVIVLFILVGVAGPHFDPSIPSIGDARTVAANRLSFFSVCLSAAITYSPGASDFLVYCSPRLLPSRNIFAATLIALSLSFSFTFLLGCGLSSGTAANPAWAAAGAGTGALIVAAFAPLGIFGSICSVVVALGLIANMVAPAYSAGVDFQILGRWGEMVPRFVWNTFGVVVFAVCALAGRDDLAAVFTNFLALMGYWVAIWIAITLEEQYIFRRRSGYAWKDWNRKDKLPLGIAALVAFVVGWVGAILCMAQHYYTGPIAKLVGDYGIDIGNYVGFAWAGLVYPPLRWWELRRFGR